MCISEYSGIFQDVLKKNVLTNPDNISTINKDATVLANKYVEVQKDDKNF